MCLFILLFFRVSNCFALQLTVHLCLHNDKPTLTSHCLAVCTTVHVCMQTLYGCTVERSRSDVFRKRVAMVTDGVMLSACNSLCVNATVFFIYNNNSSSNSQQCLLVNQVLFLQTFVYNFLSERMIVSVYWYTYLFTFELPGTNVRPTSLLSGVEESFSPPRLFVGHKVGLSNIFH